MDNPGIKKLMRRRDRAYKQIKKSNHSSDVKRLEQLKQTSKENQDKPIKSI